VGTGNPVHGFRRLMHRMKSPEDGHAMKCAGAPSIAQDP
jgi:hypothetical protein